MSIRWLVHKPLFASWYLSRLLQKWNHFFSFIFHSFFHRGQVSKIVFFEWCTSNFKSISQIPIFNVGLISKEMCVFNFNFTVVKTIVYIICGQLFYVFLWIQVLWSYVPMMPEGDESPLDVLCLVCLGRYPISCIPVQIL